MYRSTNHVFLYHAYALAAGGWVKRTNGEYEPLESIAPAVLSITGGFSSAARHNVNCAPLRQSPFGDRGPREFFVHVGHAYTEARGIYTEDANPYGEYVTTVRSVLDDFRINDIVQVEHSEAILMSRHAVPNADHEVDEGAVMVGRSNMDGVTVAGCRLRLERHDGIDDVPTHGGLCAQIHGGNQPAWIADVAQRIEAAPADAPQYAKDLCGGRNDRVLRYSLFRNVIGCQAYRPGYDDEFHTYGAGVHVPGFGRIFFGEVFASNGMKQVTMLRFDLGCDECGGYGGSGGSTNGTTFP